MHRNPHSLSASLLYLHANSPAPVIGMETDQVCCSSEASEALEGWMRYALAYALELPVAKVPVVSWPPICPICEFSLSSSYLQDPPLFCCARAGIYYSLDYHRCMTYCCSIYTPTYTLHDLHYVHNSTTRHNRTLRH